MARCSEPIIIITIGYDCILRKKCTLCLKCQYWHPKISPSTGVIKFWGPLRSGPPPAPSYRKHGPPRPYLPREDGPPPPHLPDKMAGRIGPPPWEWAPPSYRLKNCRQYWLPSSKNLRYHRALPLHGSTGWLNHNYCFIKLNYANLPSCIPNSNYYADLDW